MFVDYSLIGAKPIQLSVNSDVWFIRGDAVKISTSSGLGVLFTLFSKGFPSVKVSQMVWPVRTNCRDIIGVEMVMPDGVTTFFFSGDGIIEINELIDECKNIIRNKENN